MKNPRKILLNPGPVTLTDRVRNSLQQEDLCHREDRFSQLLLSVKSHILDVYKLSDEFDAAVLGGSGTLAVEAMLKSFVTDKDRVLVASNGVYGERMASMLNIDKMDLEHMSNDWLQGIDLFKLEEELKSKKFTKVVCVHNETTTGRLNDVEGVLDLCEKYSTPLLLDAVSSYGGEALNFSSPALFAVAATANKCLHGITGASFVVSRNSDFKSSSGNSSSLYLDLYKYWKDQKEGWCPFTPSVHSLYALEEAIKELIDTGGVENRNARYKEISYKIRNKLKQLNVPLLIDEEVYSSMISSFYLPQNKTYNEIYNQFSDKNFIIYSGQGDLANKIFRICNMGDINEMDIDNLLMQIEEIFS